jgi:hypothetical protein
MQQQLVYSFLFGLHLELFNIAQGVIVIGLGIQF